MAKFGETRLAERMASVVMRREIAVFLPAIGLAGLWFGAEAMGLLTATALGVAWVTRPLPAPLEDPEAQVMDGITGLALRPEAESQMEVLLREARQSARGTACLVLGIDEPERWERRVSRAEFDEIIWRTAERIRSAVRDCDQIARIGETRFAILLKPTPRPDLESMIQLSARLQSATEAPLSIHARSVILTTYVGFCLMSRSPEMSGAHMLASADIAAEEAMRNGPSGVRAFSPELNKAAQTRSALSAEIGDALENGQIVAFFQPQLSTDTGLVSGLQAVPRWLHRERGILTETDILPAIDSAGLRTRLAEVMLYQSFGALRDWERAGEVVGAVSLPVSPELMTNPKLAERMRWEFDRFEIEPGRIRLILPQSVLARLNEDLIEHNLSACAKIGCKIELSGFGYGPASVDALRRSSAQRLRIHRSFVARVDRDPEQQRLVSAIITMAEGLGMETLAEGVGTLGEHAMLSQLGCDQVQGRAISAPIPLEETFGWLQRHRDKLASAPDFSRRRGA